MNPQSNFIKFTTQDGRIYVLPQLTEDNAFQSDTSKGLLQFTLPSIDTIWQGFSYQSIPNSNGVYNVFISVLTTDMSGTPLEIKCTTCKSCCQIQFKQTSTPSVLEPFGTAYPG